MSNKKIAIIPARGGSKRIPRKNIMDFFGKPIIAYSIETALESEIFDEVMVSTDDQEIAQVAKKYGAKIPFMRSERNADDFATTADVLLEVLNIYMKLGIEFDYLCCIYPGTPLITYKNLTNSLSLMIEKNASGVIPVVSFNYPIQRALRINSEGKLNYIWKENINKRSQDLEITFHDAGQFYWKKVKNFQNTKSLFDSDTIPFVLNNFEAQDLDNYEDIEILKLKYSIKNNVK